MTQRVPLMIIGPKIVAKIKFLYGISNKLSDLYPSLKTTLLQTDIDLDASEYIRQIIVNVFFFFVLFFSLFFTLTYVSQQEELQLALGKTLLYSMGIVLMALLLLLRYPGILAGKKAEMVDRNLVFALKDLLLQISSGVTLYNGVSNVANSGYGEVSVEFSKVAKKINSGTPVDVALEEMAVRSKSDYLKRTTWQLVNTLKAGASLKEALRSIINDLVIFQRGLIRSYANELNLWSLIYMLFAVAVPTIGTVMLIILSSFAGIGMSRFGFIVFILGCQVMQIILIGFIKARRPVVNI